MVFHRAREYSPLTVFVLNWQANSVEVAFISRTLTFGDRVAQEQAACCKWYFVDLPTGEQCPIRVHKRFQPFVVSCTTTCYYLHLQPTLLSQNPRLFQNLRLFE